jgi:hypothetical protein
MTQVLIVPGNPLDVRPEDLEPLVEEIKLGNDLTVDVRVPPPQRGYGVTWWEVVVIYLLTKGADAVVGRGYQLILDKITEKVKHWYQERRLKRGNNRPLSLTFRDDQGHVLRALEMRATGETEEVTREERGRPMLPPPEPGEENDACSSQDDLPRFFGLPLA